MKILKKRFTLLLIVLTILIFTGNGAMFYVVHKKLINQDKAGIRRIVETAYSIIDGFYKDYKSGNLTEDEAKINVLNSLRKYRFDKDNYVFIFTYQMYNILHPAKYRMQGSYVGDLTDKSGKLKLIQEFKKKVTKDGEGFLEYVWERDGRKSDKISYIKGFPEWGWIVGSGFYTEDINPAFKSIMLSALVVSIIFTLVLSIFMYIAVKENKK